MTIRPYGRHVRQERRRSKVKGRYPDWVDARGAVIAEKLLGQMNRAAEAQRERVAAYVVGKDGPEDFKP